VCLTGPGAGVAVAGLAWAGEGGTGCWNEYADGEKNMSAVVTHAKVCLSELFMYVELREMD